MHVLYERPNALPTLCDCSCLVKRANQFVVFLAETFRIVDRTSYIIVVKALCVPTKLTYQKCKNYDSVYIVLSCLWK